MFVVTTTELKDSRDFNHNEGAMPRSVLIVFSPLFHFFSSPWHCMTLSAYYHGDLYDDHCRERLRGDCGHRLCVHPLRRVRIPSRGSKLVYFRFVVVLPPPPLLNILFAPFFPESQVSLISRNVVVQGDPDSEPTDTGPVACTGPSNPNSTYPCDVWGNTSFFSSFGWFVRSFISFFLLFFCFVLFNIYLF
jgi:hypothetical protein